MIIVHMDCETIQDMGDAGPNARLAWDSSNFIQLGDGVEFNIGGAFNPGSYYSYPLDSALNIPSLLSAGADAGRLQGHPRPYIQPTRTHLK